jgi:FAD:protein FMN transferase
MGYPRIRFRRSVPALARLVGRNVRLGFISGWLGLVALLDLSGCGGPDQPVILRGAAMGTSWRIVIRDVRRPDTHPPESLEREVTAEIERLEAEMSHWRSNSVVSRFNQSRSTDPVPVSQDLARVIGTALECYRATGGAFDITVAPLVRHYGFGPASTVPTAPVETLLQFVGSDKLQLTTNVSGQIFMRKTDPRVAIDLSAIAKGYAIDVVAGLLDRDGIQNYLIELGGELRARGRGAGNLPWRVGLEAPDPSTVGRVRRTIPLRNQGLATSGSYRQFHASTNSLHRVVSHLIDPRTGQPAPLEAVSVSVVAGTAMEADAWATALFVLGPKEGLKLAAARDLAVTYVLPGPAGNWREQSSPRFTAFFGAPNSS